VPVVFDHRRHTRFVQLLNAWLPTSFTVFVIDKVANELYIKALSPILVVEVGMETATRDVVP
jgi:hypothetical protein